MLTFSQRKNHTCTRCNRLKYPGDEGSDLNHRKLHCSDGARSSAQEQKKTVDGISVKIVEDPPPYPQPSGVFTKGTHFHPLPFLQEVKSLYERIIERFEPLTTQDAAFALLLSQRTVVVPPSADNPSTVNLFKLYSSLAIGDCPAYMLTEHDGTRYLRLDYLNEVSQYIAEGSEGQH